MNLTLLVNHYVSDGSSYFRILQRLEELLSQRLNNAKKNILEEVQESSSDQENGSQTPLEATSLPVTGPGETEFTKERLFSCSIEGNRIIKESGLVNKLGGVSPLYDVLQTLARDREKYSVIKCILSQSDLSKIKDYVKTKSFTLTTSEEKNSSKNMICSTNDTLFAFGMSAGNILDESEEVGDILGTVRLAFPMDFRGHGIIPKSMYGNATVTISSECSSSSSSSGNAAKTKSKNHYPSWRDVRKAIQEMPTSGLSLRNVLSNCWYLFIDRCNSSPSSFTNNSRTRKKSPLQLQHTHVSWAKVQHLPTKIPGFLCQKPIGLDEDKRMDLKKLMHHGSLLFQLTDDTYLFRFCHREEVVDQLLVNFQNLLGLEHFKYSRE